MRRRPLTRLLAGVILLGGALSACGGDGGGPNGIACTGGTPNLAGTWTLDSMQFPPGPTLAPPVASGMFTFVGDSVIVVLNVPNQAPPPPTIDIGGSGKCTLTPTTIAINGTGLIGQASGTYTFVQVAGALPDTLRAQFLSTGQTIRVVVTR